VQKCRYKTKRSKRQEIWVFCHPLKPPVGFIPDVYVVIKTKSIFPHLYHEENSWKLFWWMLAPYLSRSSRRRWPWISWFESILPESIREEKNDRQRDRSRLSLWPGSRPAAVELIQNDENAIRIMFMGALVEVFTLGLAVVHLSFDCAPREWVLGIRETSRRPDFLIDKGKAHTVDGIRSPGIFRHYLLPVHPILRRDCHEFTLLH
jgi:hypothetical protein